MKLNSQNKIKMNKCLTHAQYYPVSHRRLGQLIVFVHGRPVLYNVVRKKFGKAPKKDRKKFRKKVRKNSKVGNSIPKLATIFSS